VKGLCAAIAGASIAGSAFAQPATTPKAPAQAPSDLTSASVGHLLNEVCIPMMRTQKLSEDLKFVKIGRPLTSDQKRMAGIPAEARAWSYQPEGNAVILSVLGVDCRVAAYPVANPAFVEIVSGIVANKYGRVRKVAPAKQTNAPGYETSLYIVESIGAADPDRGAGLLIIHPVAGTPAAERKAVVMVQAVKRDKNNG
jgi:hypothetical protein